MMEVSGPSCQWQRANAHLPTFLDSGPGDQKAAPSHFYCSMGFSLGLEVCFGALAVPFKMYFNIPAITLCV